jgi:hypothetical protein
VIFGAFNVSLAMLRLDRYNDTWLTVSIGLLYFFTLVLCTVGFRKFKLPIWVGAFVSAVAIAIPVISHLSLRSPILDTYDTWYVTAIGLLLGAIAVRGQEYLAISAGVIFCAEVLYFGGLEYLPKSGLSGAVILLVASVAISRGLEISAKEIQVAQEQVTSELAAIEEDRTLAETYEYASKIAFRSTLPMLKKIANGRSFSKDAREEYAQKEQTLRDEISGGRLVTAKMKRAVAKARGRGVDVALLDEGGLENTTNIDTLVDLVVAALSEITSGRVTIRTQPKEDWLVRFTATRPRVVTPDLDLKLGKR